MEVVLRKNTTDDDMIDIVTKQAAIGKEILWGVVHQDFIQGESVVMDELMKMNGEITVTLEVKF